MKEFNLEKTFDVVTTIEIVERNGKYYAEVDRNFDDLWQENDEYECWIDAPDNLMTEENPTEQEYDAIIETFREYIIANGVKYARKCDKCTKGMNSGFVMGQGEEYYCSDECLHSVYTPKETQEMLIEADVNDFDTLYWTEWENESDFQYILFNNQLIEI